MVRKVALIVSLLFIHLSSFSQSSFFAVASGNWNGSGIWSLDGATPIVCSPCTAGVDFPGSLDQAYTQGFSISLPSSTNFTVGDLFVAYNVVNGITRPNLGLACTLTIKGELAAYDPDILDYAIPTVATIRNNTNNLILVFDGTSNTQVINSSAWGSLSPLRVVRFNPTSSSTILTIPTLSIADAGQLTVQNGTLQVNGSIQSQTTSATITINSGSTLRVNTGNIRGDATATSLFPTIVVEGTLTSNPNTTSYINCSSITIGSSGILNIGFSGANQTQGWWYQASAPSTILISPTSTVNYNGNASQNIFASTAYGNLSLSTISSVTKSLFGSGLEIQGNLVVGTNVTFSPSSTVDFTGTSAQSISGGGNLTFAGGIEVNKSSSTLSFNKASTVNGINLLAGTLSLGDVTTTLSGGNFIATGTVTSGTSGSLIVSGSSSFSGSGSVALNSLTVSGSASIGNSALTLTGNLTNNGSLSFLSNSTITFSGGASQSISGTNPITLGNVVVNKPSSTLSNNGTVELLSNLTMTTGTFDADGSGGGVFILNSDANGDASIGTMAGGSISGEVTFERYFNNTNNRWRNIGFPVSSVDYAELGTSFTTTNGSVSRYVESTLGNVDQGWSTVSSGTLPTKVGFSAYMYNVAPITVSVRGPLLQNQPATGGSPFDFQVTYTNDPGQPATEDGWNLLSNPFAAPMNWNAGSGWIKTGVNTAAAVWDTQGFVYQYSNGSWNGILAQGQSFWVQTNASSPILTATEAVKTSVPDPTFFRQQDIGSRLVVTLNDVLYKDKAFIQFNNQATEEFDPSFDAAKLKNPIFNLATQTPGGSTLAVNVQPLTTCSSLLPLTITNIEAGNYQLSFDGLSSFPNLDSLLLRDFYTGTLLTVTDGLVHSFNVTTDEKSYGANRFTLQFFFSDVESIYPEIIQNGDVLMSNYELGNQWLLDGEMIEGATDKQYTPLRSGNYSLMVSAGGCKFLSSTIAIDEIKNRFFPNPVTDRLTVLVDSMIKNTNAEGQVVMISPSGLNVKSSSFYSDTESVIFETGDLQKGLYLVSIYVQGRLIKSAKILVK